METDYVCAVSGGWLAIGVQSLRVHASLHGGFIPTGIVNGIKKWFQP